MPEQHYCLRWNNHQPNFISTFSSLLTDECLVDVTLAADGKYVQAHKIVLSASSVYFRVSQCTSNTLSTIFSSLHSDQRCFQQKLFSINPCQHPIVVLKDVTYRDLQSVIHFMYHGEIDVSQEHLESVLKVVLFAFFEKELVIDFKTTYFL